MTQQNEITNLVRESDDQKTPEKLFQYTSLGVLALILKNRTIRFNSLANLDDLEESQMIFMDKIRRSLMSVAGPKLAMKKYSCGSCTQNYQMESG